MGSALFGCGWGLSGFCPGPSLVILAKPDLNSLANFGGMVLGMLLDMVSSRRS
jgi:hypothetical protein